MTNKIVWPERKLTYEHITNSHGMKISDPRYNAGFNDCHDAFMKIIKDNNVVSLPSQEELENKIYEIIRNCKITSWK